MHYTELANMATRQQAARPLPPAPARTQATDRPPRDVRRLLRLPRRRTRPEPADACAR